jgi:hypothetical protein
VDRFDVYFRKMIKPFYVFWTVLSFGLSGMEFRALVTFCLVICFILHAVFNLFFIKIDIELFILFYIIGAIYLFIRGKQVTEHLADISSIDKVKNILIVVFLIIFTVLLNYLSFNLA